MAERLDATDWRMLKALQANGRMSNVDLAAHVGMTPPPCLRRLRALEQAGVIRGYTALVDEVATGFQVTAFAMVGLYKQSDAELRAFETRLQTWTIVREAHLLTGEADFMLRCVAPDLPTFQAFVTRQLTRAPNVASVKTSVSLRRAKLEPGLPLDMAVQRPA